MIIIITMYRARFRQHFLVAIKRDACISITHVAIVAAAPEMMPCELLISRSQSLSVALVQVLIVLPVQPQLSNNVNVSCTVV